MEAEAVMSYHIVSGLDAQLRDIVKRKIAAARKLLEDPANLRKWLTQPRRGDLYSITGEGPVATFVTSILPRARTNITLVRDGIQVQDFASPGYPIAELDLPGWARRFNDRWWEIRDAAAIGCPPELDDEQNMPVESVLALLNEIDA